MYGDEGPNECLASQISTHRINSWIITSLPKSIVKAPSHTLRPTAIVMENSNQALADKMSATRSSNPLLESSQGCLFQILGVNAMSNRQCGQNMQQESEDRKCTGLGQLEQPCRTWRIYGLVSKDVWRRHASKPVQLHHEWMFQSSRSASVTRARSLHWPRANEYPYTTTRNAME